MLFLTVLCGCSDEQSLKVTASAYTSSVGETDSTPNLAAWGDTLKPGMKSIAVSRDLLKMGLTHNKEVRIEGLDGTFKVLDKMNKRWIKKIDIYMGNDVKKAREWGKKEVVIYWTAEN
ncbi:3D domain-containing protein [Vibrio echinoideorum]|nr:3D domain-containing protein [Vibrio splendidus]